MTKMTKNDNASRKMQFLQPAKLSFCLSFFLSFVGKFIIVCHCGAIFSKIWKNMEKRLKNEKKLPKNGNAWRKMHFLQLAKLSFCLSIFFLSFGGKFIIFLVIVVQFSQKYGKISKLVCNMSEKSDKMTNKTADQNSNDKKIDKQNKQNVRQN